MLKFPGMRPTAEVVGILSQSVRRQQVVGMLKQEHKGDVLSLIPADPRLPHMMVNAASMPFELRQQLQVHQPGCVGGGSCASVRASSLTVRCMLQLLLGWRSMSEKAAGQVPVGPVVHFLQCFVLCGSLKYNIAFAKHDKHIGTWQVSCS